MLLVLFILMLELLMRYVRLVILIRRYFVNDHGVILLIESLILLVALVLYIRGRFLFLITTR